MEPEHCCGTCKWHLPESVSERFFVCCNDDSECCLERTDYDHTCPDWEDR